MTTRTLFGVKLRLPFGRKANRRLKLEEACADAMADWDDIIAQRRKELAVFQSVMHGSRPAVGAAESSKIASPSNIEAAFAARLEAVGINQFKPVAYQLSIVPAQPFRVLIVRHWDDEIARVRLTEAEAAHLAALLVQKPNPDEALA